MHGRLRCFQGEAKLNSLSCMILTVSPSGTLAGGSMLYGCARMYWGLHARIRYACKHQSCMDKNVHRFRAHRTIAPDRRGSRVIGASQRAGPRANTITHMSPERRRLQAIPPAHLLLLLLSAGGGTESAARRSVRGVPGRVVLPRPLDPVHRRAAIFARCLSRMP